MQDTIGEHTARIDGMLVHVATQSEIQKVSTLHRKWREQRNRKVESRAKSLEVATTLWLQRYARRKFKEVSGVLDKSGILGIERSKLAKADSKDRDRIESELIILLSKYGLAQFDSAAGDASRSVGHKWKIPRTVAAQQNMRIENKVVLLIKETEAAVRDSIRRLVSDALREVPRPSARELGRRIARQWMGPAQLRVPATEGLRGTPDEIKATADWRRDQKDLDDGGREHIFSFARAATIARTELAQAENAGIAEGYTDAKIEKVGWSAVGNDGKSKGRRHYLMNNHPPITVEAMNGSARSKWFKLPSGTRTPYPNWIGLPAGETVNCRCILVPRR